VTRTILVRLAVVLAVCVGFLTATTTPSTSDSGEGAVAAASVSQRLVSLGAQHTCAITDAGTVQCWGDNAFGQLGTGDRLTSTTPRLVEQLSGVVELAAGYSHTCALVHGGSVRCWGLNGSGQLGVGSVADHDTPQTVPGLTGVKHVASGGFHTCALLAPGTVSCWGQDGSGQLGDGSPGDLAMSPQPVSGLPAGDPVVDITAGEFHTCAVTDAGHLWCWGHNGFGQLGNNTLVTSAVPVEVGEPGDPSTPMDDVLAVTAGGGFTCAILDRANRPTYCWGENSHGQLGTTTPEVSDVMQPSKVPLRVQIDSNPSPLARTISPMVNARSVSAGQNHACAVIDGGGVRCWGQGGSGQLGFVPKKLPNDHQQDSPYAVTVPGLSVQGVVGGGFHTCVLDGGAVKCFGYNFFGQLGGYKSQVSEPTIVSSARGASSVAVGTHAVCALVSDVPGGPTSPYCWGSNADGRLGIGSTSPPSSTVWRPVIAIPTSATDLRAGNGTFCALPDGNPRKCWGLNASGELGDGTTTDRPTPVPSTHLAGATAYDLGGTFSGGAERGTACKATGGHALCWGYNGQGQLGDGTTTDSLTPVTVMWDDDPDEDDVHLVPLTGVTDVAVGGDHACALVGGGQVWCWGANGAGQLGDNTSDTRVGAVKVQQDDDADDDDPLTGVVQLAAGSSHTCARVADKVRCWGATGSGRLGRGGSGEQADEPVNRNSSGDDLEHVTDLVVGDTHACAVTVPAPPGDPKNQTLLCWGENGENQLGDKTTTDRAFAVVTLETPDPDDPLPAPWISDVSAGRDNTCVVLLETTVECWGDNTDGQVGDGIGSKSVAPVTVNGGTTYDTNQIPLPPDLTATTTPGTPVVIPVPLTGVDPDGTPVTLVSVGDPPFGSETHDASSITYTPDPGCRDDTFAYVVSDGTAQVAGQVTVLMNCPPVANPDTATVPEDGSVDIDVRANDSDPDGDTLTIDPSFPVSPAHGAVSVVGGKVRYVPAANFCGPPTDTFSYRISDGNGHQALAAVVVTVTCGPDGPTATGDAVSTPEDTTLILDDELLGNDGDVDGDSLTFTAVTQPAHGTTSTDGSKVVYVPAPDNCGPDSFTYTVSDGTASATATVTVAVTCAGDSPKAQPDSANVPEDGSVLVDVLANDTDPDGDTLGLSGALGAPAHGTAIVESGKVRYTPTANYCGPDAFTYVVTDGALTATGSVSVAVGCVNDPPTANPDSATTPEDTTVHVHVLTNDSDVDGQLLHVGTISDPPHGTAVPAGGDAVAYTPDPNYHGSDTFTYQAVDTTGAATTATVTISVTPVDDPVQLASVSDTSTVWGNALAVPLSATDPDGEPITFSVVTGPAGATTSGSAFTWTPTSTQVGPSTIKVRASSGGVNADRTFVVTVTKRPTTLTYDGPTSGQLSDAAPLHATLRDTASNAPVSGRSIGFVLGSATASGATDGSGGASGLVQVTGSTGSRTLASSFAGDAAYQSSSASTPFTVAPEAFTVTLGGTQLVTTAGTSATVTYTADLAEESDGTVAAQLAGTPVTFRRLDGSTVCTGTASPTVPGQARATCTASQPVGALPVVVSATSAAYTGPMSVGVVTVANAGTGLSSGAGRAAGDAFGFQAKPAPKKGSPSGNLVHVVVSGGTAQVVSAATVTSYSAACAGKPRVCQATIQASAATVSSVNLTTGAVTPGGTAAIRMDATDPNKYAVSVTGSVTRTIGTPAAPVVLDAGVVSVTG
jgi:alpha-tubulin suppressor-like RCC1 family protein